MTALDAGGLAVGLAAGVTSGFFGIGGGIVLVPLLRRGALPWQLEGTLAKAFAVVMVSVAATMSWAALRRG